MPRGKATPAEVELDIWEALKSGVPGTIVAQDMGVSQATVSKIKKKYQLAEQHEMERESMEMVIAGDKENGKLVCKAMDVYEGTCRRANGKMSKKTFRCAGGKHATSQWERWCEGLRAEDAKKEESEAEPKQAVVEAPQPTAEVETTANPQAEDVSFLFPIKKDRPTEEVLDELSLVSSDMVCMDLTSWSCLIAFFRERTRCVPPVEEASAPVPEPTPDEMYVTYIPEKGPHALFTDYEDAMRVTDTLNEALRFAGVDARYEVCDVKPWKE